MCYRLWRGIGILDCARDDICWRPLLLGRFLALNIVAVGGGSVGFGFGFGWFFGGPEVTGAVVAAIFHVVVLGERRNHGTASCNLADAVEDDFSAAVVELHGSVYLD